MITGSQISSGDCARVDPPILQFELMTKAMINCLLGKQDDFLPVAEFAFALDELVSAVALRETLIP